MTRGEKVMAKILVMSDSHGLTRRVETIANRHEVDLKIHCGDSELAEDATELAGQVVVRGNCDWGANFPEEKVIDIDGRRILITHGHLYGVKSSLMQLRYRALEVEADIILFGHSHIVHCEQIESQLFINPGSIRQPRNWPERSYCIIDWINSAEINVTFYDIDGNIITRFPFERTFFL